MNNKDEILSICPGNCYTKSRYAKLINKSPTWVNKLIQNNVLKEIKINGGSFVVIDSTQKTEG